MSTRVPIIDLKGFSSASASERARTVDEVCMALEQVGFFMVTGHGVPESLVERVCRVALDFFDRPEDEKLRFVSPSKDVIRGYGPMQSRTIGLMKDPTLLRSLQEGYSIGTEANSDDPYFQHDHARRNFAPNIWPDRPADFEPALTAYYAGMRQLFRTIMRLFAIALDLPESFFDDKITRNSPALRLIHYPTLTRAPLPGEERAGAHSDTGALTILHIDDTPDSLQVETRSGEWININRVPGAFVINIGDMMMRWTNDKWVSTVHRVVNPPFVNGRSERRLSIAAFCGPNYDTMVECLPNCSSPGNPPRYQPITAGDYAYMRAANRYGFKEAKAS
jgi:isopenicillin N synthase-like dioxygenase